jgi:pimeloyl-ACP methyl ester carboxylesterase
MPNPESRKSGSRIEMLRTLVNLALMPLLLACNLEAQTRYAASADGTRIAYDVAGSGPALILLHGGGQTRRVWHEGGYVARLTPEFTVITVDMRGSGESDKPDVASGYEIEKLRRDVLAVADAAGADRFILWGFSYGANIGRYLAVSSDRVRSMVYVGIPFGRPVDPVFERGIREFSAKWTPVVEAAKTGTPNLDALSAADRAMWNRGGVAVQLAWLTALTTYPPIEPSAMRVPTLWLVGTQNTGAMASVTNYRDRLAGTPVRLSLLEGLDHPQEFDRIDTVLPLVLPFIRGR